MITSLCSGGVVCLIELWVNSIKKQKEEKYRYRKEITQKYGDLLYNVYRIFHVTMEPLLKFRKGEVDIEGLMEESKEVYYHMLELDYILCVPNKFSYFDSHLFHDEHDRFLEFLF